MAVKLSLTAKSLMLVLIPFLFGMGFVWALVSLQHETEVEAQHATKAHAISAKLGSIQSKLYQAFSMVRSKHNSIEEAKLATDFFSIYKKTFQPLLSSLADDYAALEEMTRDRPDVNKLAKQSATGLAQIRTLLDKNFVKLNQGEIEEVASNYRAGADMVVSNIEDMARENFAMVAQFEHDSAEVSSKRHAATRQSMVLFVLIACAFNLAFCAFLAIFLVKGIVSRLGVMNENARLLAASQPLHQPIGGNDEITELDRVFHRMAADIEETARMRQELVSMLTHDLRSPLTAIQGSLELLELKTANTEDEREKRLLEVAQRNSTRMMRLINDLLDIHKIKEGMMTFQPVEVCLAEVLEDVALSVSGWIEDNDIKLKYDDTDLFVYGERAMVERIIFNLVANAIKYSPPGGLIRITAQSKQRMVEIVVSDQGKGIPRDQQQSIFERFQQVDGDQKQSAGSGLGLTICQVLVQMQGGEIWVVSEPDKGSEFHFTLPLS